jgi:hypothetical protein
MPTKPEVSQAFGGSGVKAAASQKKKADAAARKKAAAEKRASAKAAADVEPKPAPAFEVRALRDPYRRAGLALGRNAITVVALSKDQLKALSDDPNVIITPAVVEEED